jgi:hypothetical protein
MLGYDAVVQPFVQLWATVDWDGAASCEGDRLHQVSVGWGHLTNFSKGFASDGVRDGELLVEERLKA